METVVQEDTLTAEEREQARAFLKQTYNSMVGAVRGMTDAQWHFRPAPDNWSAAQVVEHAICVLDLVGTVRRQALLEAPIPPAGQDPRIVDTIVMSQFSVRLRKFPTPPIACPANRFATVDAGLQALKASYSTLAEFLDATPDLREHALDAPPLKAVTNGAYEVMDGYQWILAAASHTERHAKQILELKADAGFPAV